MLPLTEGSGSLIVGSRGRGPLSAALLRGTSAGLASTTECPVLVLPALADAGYAVREGEPPADDARWGEMWIERVAVARAWGALLAEWPLILGSVAAEPPFPPGADLTDEWRPARILRAFRLVVPMNLLGLPAGVMPVGTAAGPPHVVPRPPRGSLPRCCRGELSGVERTPSKASQRGAVFVSTEQHPKGD